jgi:hypothetical protein
MVKINTKIPITDDVMDIKDKALELQNYYSEIADYVNALQYMLDQANSIESYLRDQSLLDADKDENYKSKAAQIKTAYGKVNFTYSIKIESPIKELEKIEGEYSYDSFKNIVALIQYKYNRAKSKLDEIRSAIEVCKFYPVKM